MAARRPVHPGLPGARSRRGGIEVLSAPGRALRCCRLLALALLALLPAACDTQTDRSVDPQARVGTQLAARQQLRRAVDTSPRSIDPTLSTDVPGERVMDDIFEGLTTLAADGSVAPGVARRWEVSADGLHYTFHLRTDALWSNGAPVTAGDFVYAWRRLVDPATAADYAQSLAPVRNALQISEGKLPATALGIQAGDAHTLEVELQSPTPYFLDLLTKAYTYPLYGPVIRAHGDDWVKPQFIVGNGPFLLVEHVLGSRVTLRRNPRYWDAAHVRLQQVTYYPVDRAVQTDRFIAGDIDFTDSFPAQQIAWLRERLGSQVVTAPYNGIFMVDYNMLRGPFAGNRELRLALSMAVDREILVEKVRHDMYVAAWSLTPPLPGYGPVRPAWQALDRAARLAEARRLYAAAGYSREHPLRVELTYPSDPDNLRIFEAVAAMWRENLGAEVAVRNQEFKVLINNRRMHALTLFMYAWIGDYPDPYTYQQLFQTGFGVNDGGYANPRYDALLAAANALPDRAQRYRLQAQAEEILNQDVPYIPLYFYASRHLIKPWVGGWVSNLSDRNLSRYMYILEHD